MKEAHWYSPANRFPVVFTRMGLFVVITGTISTSDAVKRITSSVFIFGAFLKMEALFSGIAKQEP